MDETLCMLVADMLGVSSSEVTAELSRDESGAWDSLAHFRIVTAHSKGLSLPAPEDLAASENYLSWAPLYHRIIGDVPGHHRICRDNDAVPNASTVNDDCTGINEHVISNPCSLGIVTLFAENDIQRIITIRR